MEKHPLLTNLPLLTEFPTREQWEAAVWEIVIDRLAKLQSETELKKVVKILVGPYEKRTILYRALMASRLYSGIGPSEISRELWKSRSTINAIKKSLVEGEYKSYDARGHKKKEFSKDMKPKRQINSSAFSDFYHKARLDTFEPRTWSRKPKRK